MPEGNRGDWLAFALCGVLTLATWSAMVALRPGFWLLRGDEATYVAMTASLARDGDLRFTEVDRQWAESTRPGGPAPLILQRTEDGISYSKPILYPLLAAPFYAVAGDWGMLVANALLLGAALVLLWGHLRSRSGVGERGHAAWTLATFAGAAVLLPYVAWRMTEAMGAALALSGLVLCLNREEGETNPASRGLDCILAARWAPYFGAVLLGLLVTQRYPNAILAAAPAITAGLAGRVRRALGLALAAALAFFIATAVTEWLTGAPNPYRAVRATFNSESGYPAGVGGEQALIQFDTERATQTLALAPRFDLARSAYSGLYFLVGRHSGLLAYFPALIAFLPAALRRPRRHEIVLILAAAGLALFYLLWMPENYFGGATFLGNRYFLPVYPALLLAARQLPSRRQLAVAWALACLVGVSALVGLWRTRDLDAAGQGHTAAGLFRLLPYESTARSIDGRRDRYWSGDFVRFVDPFALAEQWSFRLSTESPPAEFEIATWWRGDRLRFLAHSDSPVAELEASDWAGRHRLQLTPRGGGSGGLLELEPAAAWRRHSFWWEPGNPYWVRTVRLRLKTGDGKPAAATVRYLGDGAALKTRLEREILGAEIPAQAVAGSVSRLPIRVVNRGDRAWTSAAVLPVQLAYRLQPVAGGEFREGRTALPRRIRPGEELAAAVEVRWPDQPERYRLTLDLVLEEVAWFSERVGAPLAEGIVEVVSTGAAGSPAAEEAPSR